jgi:hypothetical protein
VTDAQIALVAAVWLALAGVALGYIAYVTRIKE